MHKAPFPDIRPDTVWTHRKLLAGCLHTQEMLNTRTNTRTTCRIQHDTHNTSCTTCHIQSACVYMSYISGQMSAHTWNVKHTNKHVIYNRWHIQYVMHKMSDTVCLCMFVVNFWPDVCTHIICHTHKQYVTYNMSHTHTTCHTHTQHVTHINNMTQTTSHKQHVTLSTLTYNISHTHARRHTYEQHLIYNMTHTHTTCHTHTQHVALTYKMSHTMYHAHI